MPSLFHCEFSNLSQEEEGLLKALERDGAAIIPGALGTKRIEHLTAHIHELPRRSQRRSRSGASYAARNLLEDRTLQTLSSTAPLSTLASLFLGASSQPIRGLLFDKSPSANWKVPWHQDLSIALAERIEAPGFGPWSVKAGVVHAHAPTRILNNCISLRLHLDVSNEKSGALQVILGSHRRGRLEQDQVQKVAQAGVVSWCRAKPGDILVMSPLLLHRSSRATEPTRRRTLHFEYSSATLPTELSWAYHTSSAT